MVWLFLCGLFSANGIPHFVNGISGRDFHNPSLHRLMPDIPSPMFNVIWGLLNFGLAIFLASLVDNFHIGANASSAAFAIGFISASIGLSIFFHNSEQRV